MYESACSIRKEKKNTASVPFAKSLRKILHFSQFSHSRGNTAHMGKLLDS